MSNNNKTPQDLESFLTAEEMGTHIESIYRGLGFAHYVDVAFNKRGTISTLEVHPRYSTYMLGIGILLHGGKQVYFRDRDATSESPESALEVHAEKKIREVKGYLESRNIKVGSH